MKLKNNTFIVLMLLASIVFWLGIIKVLDQRDLSKNKYLSYEIFNPNVETSPDKDKLNQANDFPLNFEQEEPEKFTKPLSIFQESFNASLETELSKKREVRATTIDKYNQVQRIVDNIQSKEEYYKLVNPKNIESIAQLENEIRNLREKLRTTRQKDSKVKGTQLAVSDEKGSNMVNEQLSYNSNLPNKSKKNISIELENYKSNFVSKSTKVRSVQLKEGESIWMLAERVYGDGKQYIKILKANPNLTKKMPNM